MNALFDFISSTKLDIEVALTSPEVQAFMREAGIKVKEAQAEAAKRKQKKNLMLYGAAALVIGFLIIRKK